MMLVRVYQLPDGTVAIKRFNQRMKRAEETDEAFMDRIIALESANRLEEGLPPEFNNIPYMDVDSATLPPRIDRKDWTVEDGVVMKKIIK